MLKRFNKAYFYFWIVAAVLVVIAEVSMRKKWQLSLHFGDTFYFFGYNLVFDLLALLSLTIGIVLWVRSNLKKKTR